MDKINYNKRCSICLHSVMQKKYKNTIPSIHTCMNKESGFYLVPQAWSSTCDKWKEEPKA